MNKFIKFVVIMLVFVNTCTIIKADVTSFSDVAPSHWAYNDILEMRTLGLTTGIGNNLYGIGRPVKRSEFVLFMKNLTQAEDIEIKGLDQNESATREDMAVMIVRALGYESLAKQINVQRPFKDVLENAEYITVVRDLGIMSGTGGENFSPEKTATREEAGAIIMRMHRKLNTGVNFVNGFYAIKSSNQMNLITNLDSVSYGWSRLDYISGDVYINIKAENDNEYRLPQGYEEPLNFAKNNGKQALLMVTTQDTKTPDGLSLTEKIVSDANFRKQAISQIIGILDKYDGVCIDFENLAGPNARTGLTVFLTELKGQLGGKTLFTAVHPRRSGQDYFDGYDFKAIGEIADKVILMAHDYNAKRLTGLQMEQGIVMTPLTPIADVYEALKEITDTQTGISDKNKILLQISMDTAQWKKSDGKVINDRPYRPDYETLAARIKQGVTNMYDEKSENPYITFTNESDNTQNIVWYENDRSVNAKIKLMKMFGVSGLSVWRLGNIPDDVYKVIENRG